MLFVLQLSAVALCGDRWTDLRHWYLEQDIASTTTHVNCTDWDHRVLHSLHDCWVRLFRNQGRTDLFRVGEIIAGLRNDQDVHEKRLLARTPATKGRAIAMRLAALYNWAKATETLATYMLQGEPTDPFGVFDRHFDAGIKMASASGDSQLEILLRWLRPTARIMVSNSL